MAAEIAPPELARLVDHLERPRAGDWSLRAALVRYAQPEPRRVGQLLEVARRIEFAVRPHLKTLQRDGPTVWQALQGDGDGVELTLIGLLRAMTEIDSVGEALAIWAVDPHNAHRPDAEVDRVTAEVAGRLDELGVAREERQPTRRRG